MEKMPQTESKDYAIMGLNELEANPVTAEILQKKAFEYLTTVDKEWFGREFTGELTPDGHLVDKNGEALMTPMQNIGGGKALEWVMRETKLEMLKDASSEEKLRVDLPQELVSFEALLAEMGDGSPAEHLAKLQEFAKGTNDPKIQGYLRETARGLIDKPGDYDAAARSIMEAFIRRGEEFGMRHN